MRLGDMLSRLFKKENEKEDEKGIKKEISLAELRKKEVLLAEHRTNKDLESTDDEENPESFSGLLEQEIYTETMGDLYMNQESYERAIRVFEKLLESDPENKPLQTRLERARARLIEGKTNF